MPNGPTPIPPDSDEAPDASHRRRKPSLRDYVRIRDLGDGSFGHVVEVEHRPTGRRLAMKVLSKADVARARQLDSVRSERTALVALSHPNVVALQAAFQDKDSFYFVTELGPNGSLESALANHTAFARPSAQIVIAQVLLGIAHMHSRRIVHRDLKPANIVLDAANRAKICDFGSAKIYSQNENFLSPVRSEFTGSATYISPEALQRNEVCPASDLWAFGCMLYRVVVGRPPFEGTSNFHIFEKIGKADYQIPEFVARDAKDLIQKLLVVSPSDRLGSQDYASGYQTIRQHPFFAGIDWDTVATRGIERFEVFIPVAAIQKRPLGKVVKESPVRVLEGENRVEKLLAVTDCGQVWLRQSQEDEEIEINQGLKVQFDADILQLRCADKAYTIQIGNNDTDDWKEIFESLTEDM